MMMRRMVLMTAFAVTVSQPVWAFGGPPAALDGFCPVCLVRMDKLVKGDPAISSVYDGKTYLFPSDEQKRIFDANPTAFVPALGGDCAVCKVEKGIDVPGKPEFQVKHDGRLFLFPSPKQKKMFESNPERYADADLALGGACAVCLVKKNELVAGKTDYASIYDGRRYLFPGAKQKRMFDVDPAAFAPAMGGNCPVCKVEMGNEVAGKADFNLTHKNRLYLFPSQKQIDMFKADPTRYADADVAMNGYCPVCKIEMGKDVKGRPDLAVDFGQKRYLFPGRKQLEMFVANPDKYAID